MVRKTVFSGVRKELGWETEGASLSLRILVLHHHLTATENFESPDEYSKGFGMAIDAKKILRDAADCGVHLVLHGHRHRVFVWREGVYALPDSRPRNGSLVGSRSWVAEVQDRPPWKVVATSST